MPTTIDIKDGFAVEKSTAKVVVSFTDESGAAVVPTSINWSLTTSGGAAINSRNQVVVASPAASITIGLTGDDLAFQSGESGSAVKRVFTVEAVYNSDLGSGLHLKDQMEFYLKNLAAVS